MDVPPLYIVDTSSLIGLYNWRPPRSHRPVWEKLENLIRNDRLISPEQVYDEIRAGTDALATWALRRKKRRILFKRTTQQVARIAKQIIGRFPDFIEKDRPVPQADPFVIALAVFESEHTTFAQKCVVLTEEKWASTGRPRIPTRLWSAQTLVHVDPSNVRLRRLDVLRLSKRDHVQASLIQFRNLDCGRILHRLCYCVRKWAI
jgi:hypothetical protein